MTAFFIAYLLQSNAINKTCHDKDNALKLMAIKTKSEANMDKTIGSCNCGAVSFAINAKVEDVYVCHCSICRKSTGGTGIAVTVVANESFEWLSGKQEIRTWHKPNHDWLKQFCQQCGSPLPGANDPERTFVPVGLLDSGYEQLTVKHHIWVDSKASWEVIGDDGKQHPNAFQG